MNDLFGASMAGVKIAPRRGKCPKSHPIHHKKRKLNPKKITHIQKTKLKTAITIPSYFRSEFCARPTGWAAMSIRERVARRKKARAKSLKGFTGGIGMARRKRSKGFRFHGGMFADISGRKRRKRSRKVSHKRRSRRARPLRVVALGGHRRGMRRPSFKRSFFGGSGMFAGGCGFGDSATLSIKESVTGTFTMPIFKGLGAGAAGYVIGKGVQGLVARFLLKDPSYAKIVQVIGAVGGAIGANVFGNLVLKSREAGEMGAVANLLIAVDALAGDQVNKAMKIAGLGYSDGLGQVFLPEEVKLSGFGGLFGPVAGIEGLGQVFLPESTQMRGLPMNINLPMSQSIPESSLLGVEGVDEGGIF